MPFLWEKYTTYPFCEQEKCRYIDEVVTPWPCFVIAVRNEVYEKNADLLDQMCQVINKTAEEVKLNPETADSISWRYNLPIEQTKSWLADVDWNYKGDSYPEAFADIVKYLLKLNLIDEKQSEDYNSKLFFKQTPYIHTYFSEPELPVLACLLRNRWYLKETSIIFVKIPFDYQRFKNTLKIKIK